MTDQMGLIKFELLKCLDSPSPVFALEKWWDKHICEFGQITHISREYLKHLKDDWKNYKVHQDKVAAYKMGEALYNTKVIHRETEETLYDRREKHRVYVVVVDTKMLPDLDKGDE